MQKPLAAYIAPRAFNAYRENMREVLVSFYSAVTKIGFRDDVELCNNNKQCRRARHAMNKLRGLRTSARRLWPQRVLHNLHRIGSPVNCSNSRRSISIPISRRIFSSTRSLGFTITYKIIIKPLSRLCLS